MPLFYAKTDEVEIVFIAKDKDEAKKMAKRDYGTDKVKPASNRDVS